MAARRASAEPAMEERTKRQERAGRILDAAAELTLRWGYNKTTIDDIARQAGVAKGTIYLHWKTREELFRALLAREAVFLAEEMQPRMANDPEGMTIHGMMKHSVLAISKRPLMKAVILRDSELLGAWERYEYSQERTQLRLDTYSALLRQLRERGLVRTDLSERQENYILSFLGIGILMVDPWLPDDFKLSDEEAADMLAETVRRTLEPRDAPVNDAQAARSLAEYMDFEVQVAKKRNQEEMES
ncbi:MAG TPA: helix-turn-helix domain-containing protein [Ktedonobacteraceae bacterium]|nr:helix-turn-helix domain-containing protein [Ktedonobacteraceae bacterium]